MDTIILPMQKIVRTIVVVSIVTLLGACRYDKIAGNWESVEQKGGIANIMEIRSDGTLMSSLLVRIDRDYRFEGDKLIVVTNPVDKIGAIDPARKGATADKLTETAKKPPDRKSSAKQKKPEQDKSLLSSGQENEQVVYVLEFNNDKLKMTHEGSDGAKEVLDLTRQGEAATPGSIVGHWTFRHQTGKTAHMVFNANGSMHFRMVLPFGTESSYEVKSDTITLYNKADANKPVMSGTYRLEDGKFVLDDGKSITHYARVDESKWGAPH